MVQRHPLTVHVPIKGKVLIRLDGTEVLHEVGDFSQDVSIAFAPGPGEVSFQFDQKFWEANVKGGRMPDPLDTPGRDKSTHNIVLELLDGALAEFPSDLAERICAELSREGRLSA